MVFGIGAANFGGVNPPNIHPQAKGRTTRHLSPHEQAGDKGHVGSAMQIGIAERKQKIAAWAGLFGLACLVFRFI